MFQHSNQAAAGGRTASIGDLVWCIFSPEDQIPSVAFIVNILHQGDKETPVVAIIAGWHHSGVRFDGHQMAFSKEKVPGTWHWPEKAPLVAAKLPPAAAKPVSATKLPGQG